MTVESSIEEKITIRPFQVKDCQALSSTQIVINYVMLNQT